LPPEQIVLGLDTSAAHCAAAVVCGDRVLACRTLPMDTGQAEALMPLIDTVLAEAGVTFDRLAVIGVGTGPGNFTGVRIAVAAARGLALGLGIPAIGVSGFDAATFDMAPDVVALLDARRGAVWLSGTGLAPQQATPDALPGGLAGRDVTGQRASEIAALSGGRALPQAVPLPVAIARIAVLRAATPQPRPAPLYLRPADAAPPSDPAPVLLP
jgi:tRNA threonylcarbamoyladenosine biosynthesis protein TsaB